MLEHVLVYPGIGEEYNGDMLFEDLDCMVEPEDVMEELEFSPVKNNSKCFVTDVGKTKQDAEKQAVELLATRLGWLVSFIFCLQ